MKPMHNAARKNFLLTVALVWVSACIAAYFYSQKYNIPASIVSAVLPALLLELAFYLAPGFEAPRRWLGNPTVLWISALAPYMIASVALGSFAWLPFASLVAITGVLTFWFVWMPRAVWADLAFLAIAAAVYMSKAFALIYAAPSKHVPLDFLGKLMWIRLGMLLILTIRGVPVRVGFWPSRKEWRAGALHFAAFLPLGVLLSYAIGFARFQPAQVLWWRWPLLALGSFCAFLWVVALSEEFFFRGVLQPLLVRSLGSQTGGLLFTSLLFGLVHLPFKAFPNWRFALLSGVAGIFYGLAYRRAGGVRASMVCHALVVTTWRLFFTS